MRKALYLMIHLESILDWDWLNVCLKSYCKVCEGSIYLIEDNLTSNQKNFLEKNFRVHIIHMDNSEWEGRRTLCRMEGLVKVLEKIKGQTQLIMADIDVLFLQNPYTAYDGWQSPMDIGFTPRLYRYEVPVNSGIVFYRTTYQLLFYAKWAVQVVQDLSWTPYKEVMSKRDNLDWGCDQDFIHAISLPCSRSYLHNEFYLRVEDVGYKYNCCVGSDVLGDDEAVHLMKYLFDKKKYPVLHFKGERMKQLIYEFNIMEIL